MNAELISPKPSKAQLLEGYNKRVPDVICTWLAVE